MMTTTAVVLTIAMLAAMLKLMLPQERPVRVPRELAPGAPTAVCTRSQERKPNLPPQCQHRYTRQRLVLPRHDPCSG